MFFLTDYIIAAVGVLFSVAFFTLMERKLMGLAHYRKGPNKVATFGVSQPVADAMKLLSKELPKMENFKMVMFMSGPLLMLVLMLLCWGWYQYQYSVQSTSMKILIISSILGLSSYGFILTSWGSNSKYSTMGGLRVIAQVISYEVCLVLFILVIAFLASSFNTSTFKLLQMNLWFGLSFFPVLLIWMLLCMAESNRTPFDLAEGESEIVSGFNIEYAGGLFALIFISEYGMMIFLSFISTMLFLGGTNTLIKTMLFCFFYVFTRVTLPRVRYDELMMITWKLLTPLVLSLLMMSLVTN